jgi:hypothetical protein
LQTPHLDNAKHSLLSWNGSGAKIRLVRLPEPFWWVSSLGSRRGDDFAQQQAARLRMNRRLWTDGSSEPIKRCGAVEAGKDGRSVVQALTADDQALDLRGLEC